MSEASRPDRRRGVVLVTVLWTIALLSALAMAAAASFRGFAGVLAIDRDRVQADALLTAGVEAGADLLAKHRNRPLRPIATRLTLSSGAVLVRLSDELGKIDINKAPIEVFTSLFSALGIPDAVDLARAVVVWRDGEVKSAAERAQNKPPQQVPTPPGSAAGATQPAGRPEDAQEFEQTFTSVGQLAQISGMRLDYVASIAPFATVFGDETVNALTASPDVLRLLPMMNEARIARLEEARSIRPVDPARIEQILGPASAFVKPQSRSVARLELTASLADGYSAAAEAVIVILPKDRQPYRVLSFTPAPTPLAYARGF